jgi:WD40 repeat protein
MKTGKEGFSVKKISITGLLIAVLTGCAHLAVPHYAHFADIECEGEDFNIAYSPDGSRIALAHTTRNTFFMSVFDAQSREMVYTVYQSALQVQMYYSPDSRYLVSADWGSRVLVLNAADGTLYKSLSYGDRTVDAAHYAPVRTVAYSPDGRFAASGSNDRTLKLWNTADWSVVYTREHDRVVNCVSFSPNGKYLVSGCSDSTVRVWETAGGKLLHTMTAEGARSVNTAVCSPDGKYIAAGYDDSDNKVRIWNAATGKLERTLDSGRTWDVAYSPDGKYLAAATTEVRSLPGGLKLYTTSDWSFTAVTDKDTMNAAFSPDGSSIAASSEDIVSIYRLQY